MSSFVDCNASVHLFRLFLSSGSYQIYSVYPPKYNKNATDPNSLFTAPDNKLSLTLTNQNQSLPHINQTLNASNNQTLLKLIESLALSNKANREHLHPPQAPQVTAALLHCDRTVYLFAFWTTTLYVFAGNSLVMIICFYGLMMITNKISEYLTM